MKLRPTSAAAVGKRCVAATNQRTAAPRMPGSKRQTVVSATAAAGSPAHSAKQLTPLSRVGSAGRVAPASRRRPSTSDRAVVKQHALQPLAQRPTGLRTARSPSAVVVPTPTPPHTRSQVSRWIDEVCAGMGGTAIVGRHGFVVGFGSTDRYLGGMEVASRDAPQRRSHSRSRSPKHQPARGPRADDLRGDSLDEDESAAQVAPPAVLSCPIYCVGTLDDDGVVQ